MQVATPTPNWPDQQPSHGRNKSSDYFFAQTRNDYWMPYTADNQSELSALTINEFTDSLRKDTKEKKAEQIKRLCRHELVTGGGWQDCWRYKATVVDGTKKENMNQVAAKAEGFGRSDGVTDEEACGPGYHQCGMQWPYVAYPAPTLPRLTSPHSSPLHHGPPNDLETPRHFYPSSPPCTHNTAPQHLSTSRSASRPASTTAPY